MAIDPIKIVDNIVELTDVINDRIKPPKPLSVIFGAGVRKKNLITEDIQLQTLTGDYKMAPFVSKNGKPSSITRKGFETYTIDTPCIKIEAPLTDSDQLLKRRAGNLDAATDTDVMRQNALETIAEDADEMNEMVALREEWLWSQLLTGTVSYEDTDTNTSWEVSTKKPAGNTIVAPVLWDQEGATIYADMKTCANIIQNDNNGPAPKIALHGVNSAAALNLRIEKGWVLPMKTDSGVLAGNAQLMAEYDELGMSYMGRIGGLDHWEVTGTLTDDKGVETPLIRDDYMEVFSNGPRAKQDRMKYYGRKRGITGTLDGTAIGEKSARAYVDEKADVYVQEIQTRPWFWIKHAQWYVSMKTI